MLNDDVVLSLIGFGIWVSLLMFALCVAGGIADRIHRRHDKRRSEFDYLTEAVEADRAHRDKLDRAA
jgi:hypothetical protein